MVDGDILAEFKIFVQSTSYNRNLIGGTTFLYEKDEDGPSAPKSSRRDPGLVLVSPIGDIDVVPSISSISSSRVPISTAGSSSNKVEIVISFDTTGSMYPCLSTVRSVIRDTLIRLTTHIPTIRIGILAHGDYCDLGRSYVTCAANDYKLCGAGQLNQLIDFVFKVGQTGGGDFPECYELVLREVATKFDWSADTNKSLIMIGDAPPHEPNDNLMRIDWRIEAEVLKVKGIRVYAVQAMDYEQSKPFYNQVAKLTMGFHLKLHQFSSIPDFLIAVCFHEGDNAAPGGHLTRFEDEVNSSGRMVTNLRQLFDQLQGRAPPTTKAPPNGRGSSSGPTALVPVSPSRFQVLNVDVDQAIKQFAEDRGLVFKAGRGFYEFTKPESVSDKKEIVLMDKTTGDFYTGWTAARELSGIEPGKATKQKPKDSDKYVVFIQSTSYNRKLNAGHKFLYEVDTER